MRGQGPPPSIHPSTPPPSPQPPACTHTSQPSSRMRSHPGMVPAPPLVPPPVPSQLGAHDVEVLQCGLAVGAVDPVLAARLGGGHGGAGGGGRGRSPTSCLAEETRASPRPPRCAPHPCRWPGSERSLGLSSAMEAQAQIPFPPGTYAAFSGIIPPPPTPLPTIASHTRPPHPPFYHPIPICRGLSLHFGARQAGSCTRRPGCALHPGTPIRTLLPAAPPKQQHSPPPAP